MTFRLVPHAGAGAGSVACEVWDGENLLARMYPTRHGVQIVSEFFREQDEYLFRLLLTDPALEVQLKPKPKKEAQRVTR